MNYFELKRAPRRIALSPAAHRPEPRGAQAYAPQGILKYLEGLPTF